MKRLYAALGALSCVLGCATESDKGQWDEFWKDLRGDNMKMRCDFSGARRGEGPTGPMPVGDQAPVRPFTPAPREAPGASAAGGTGTADNAGP
jgi:hypothetical protein